MRNFDLYGTLERIFTENNERLPLNLRGAEPGEDFCGRDFKAKGCTWECSRPAGHEGKHVAHGRLAQICAIEE